MKTKPLLWFSACLFLLGILGFQARAQVMISPTGKPASLIICHDDGTFSLLIANITGSTMSGATLLLDLPAGCLYTPGSVTAATQLNISNLNQPTFTLPDILNNTAHTVTYDARLICGYTNTENFNYIVTYNSSTYTGFDTPLQNYYFPVLVITNITNGSASIPVGQTVTRDITVEQQGLNSTMDTLTILDSHTSDIQVLSTSIGTLHLYVGPGPIRTDTIIITGSDLPGGNNYFDYGESIIIGETVQLLGCDNGQSTLKAAWGCNKQYCSYYTAFPSVSPAAGSTIINMAFTGLRKDWGFIDNSGWVEFTVSNTGSGYGTAFNLVVLAGFSSGGSTYYPNANWLNKIDSFSVSGNYLAASYNYAAGATNGRYAYYTTFQYTSDPDGPGVGLEDADNDGFFDDLPIGKSIMMKAHTYYDWAAAMTSIPIRNTCGQGWTNSAWQAFRFGYNYIDQCLDPYGVHWIPNGNLLIFHTYNTYTSQHTMPPDLYDGQTAWMEQTVVTSTAASSQGCPNDSVIYKVILSPGITIAPGTATFKGVSMGTANIIGDTAIYYLDRTRVLTGGLFRVPIMVVCEENPPPLGSITTRLQFWCHKSYYPDRYFTYWCSTSPIFGLQCPLGDCPDPYISSFTVKRTTLGWTNSACTTRVAPTAPGLRLDNAMAGDSIRIEASGVLNGAVDSLYFRLQQNGMAGAWGNQLFFTILADTLFYFDMQIDRRDTCIGLSPQVINGATSYVTTYLGGLTSPGGCLEGLSFSDGDSIRYVIAARVRNVAYANWLTVPVLRGRFYWKNQGTDEFCNDRGFTFNVLGSYYSFVTSTWYQQIILQGCNSFLYEGLIYRTLDQCGGDVAFPSEIRPFCVLDSMTFILPEGFVYETGSSRHSYIKDNGGQQNDVIPDPLISVSALGTRLIYARAATWGYADHYDCYVNYDRITFYASPSCEALGNYTYQMYSKGRSRFYADGAGVTSSGSATVAITYTPPSVALTALTPTAEGREDTVTWEVRLCNVQSFTAGYNWLGFEHSAEGITVARVIDITNPATPINYPVTPYAAGKTWVQLGSLAGSACRNYLVKAVYTVCDFDSLLVRHGFNCAGYPVNPDLGYPPSGYICTENTTHLYLDPKDVVLNLAITSPVNPVNLCDTLTYEAVVTNSQLSYAFDLKLTVAIPPGISIVPGSALFKYPYSTGSFVSLNNPVNFPAGSNKWVYDISNDPNGVDYLLGVDSLPKNGYRLQFRIVTNCDFTSGRSMQLIASASNACGEIKARSSYTQQILITGIPTNVNLYVINTATTPGFQTCSSPSPVHVKVINLGPSSVSTIEKLKITIDDAYDMVAGSLINIHNGPAGVINSVIAGIRYLDFAIEPNLAVNDSIVFDFQLEDIDPGSLMCDTIPLETNTLLVAKVYCDVAPNDSCFIYSITSTQVQFKPILKDHLAFGRYNATSVPNGTTGETVTITYAVKNTGADTLNAPATQLIFVHDANNNGIPDETGSDSLFSQTVSTGGMLPGDSTLVTATFSVPGNKVCRMLAAIRFSDNSCACGDAVLPINSIHLLNAGPDVEVCMQTNAQLGMPGITGYTYFWVPTLFLSSPSVPDPIFNYNTLLTQADTTNYILNTTRPGNCVTRDTTRVIVLPSAVAFAGADTVACKGYSHLLADASVINSTNVLWSSSGTGAFDTPTLVNATYTPSVADWTLGTVTLTLFADGLCGDDTDAKTLTFNNAPTAYAGPDTAVCANWTYTVTGATATNFTGLLWSTLGDGNFSSTTILAPVYTPGPADITAGSVALILQASGQTSCPVIKDTMILVLPPPPVVTNSPPSKTICSQGFTNILLTSSQPGTTFTWTAALTSGAITGFSDGTGPLIDQQLINTLLVPGSVTYTITPTNGGCIGQPLAFQVTVNPLPAVTNTNSDTSFCSGGSTGIGLLANIALTTFSWTAAATSSNITGFSNGSGPTINQPLTNSGVEPDTVLYTVTPQLNGCSGSDSVFTVTVFPLPATLAQPPSLTLCSGDSATIALSSLVSGSTYSWNATASSLNLSGYFSGSGDTISQVLINSGTSIDTVFYSIAATANGCTGSSLSVPVIVNPIPSVTSSLLPQTICSGEPAVIPLSANVAGTGFTWTASTSGNLTGFTSGSGDTIRQVITNTGYSIDTLFYFITPSANGCSGITVVANVVVNPVPDLSNTPPSTGICNNDWTNVTLASNVAGTSFTWSCTQLSGNVTGWSPNAIPATLLNQQLTNAGAASDSVIYHITPAANGCSGPVTDFTASVFPLPDVFFNPASPVVCSGGITAIQCLSQVPSSTFSWITAIHPNVSGNQSGSGNLIADTLWNPGTQIETIYYIVTPEAFGCPPGISDTVFVAVNPIPEVTNPVRSYSVCNQGTFQIPLQANLVYPTTFSWIASASSPAVSGYSNGSGGIIQQTLFNSGYNVDTVCYIVTPQSNSCNGDTAHFRVIVFPVPDVLILPLFDTLCSGDSCRFDLSSHVANPVFTWTPSPSSGSLSGFSPGSGPLILQKLSTSGFIPETVTYAVSPFANGCPGIQEQGVATVKPSPIVNLPVCFDTITTTGARPILLRGGTPLGGVFSGNFVSGATFDPGAAGVGRHPVSYAYTNRFTCMRNDTVFISVVADPPFTCGEPLTDIRNNRSYPTVQIGTQCWFAANLNYGVDIPATIHQRDNCLPEKYLLPSSLFPLPSALYQWDEVMDYSESPGVKGLCPPGWHIPTENDWSTLFSVYICNGFAGNPLKVTGYSGFNAFLEGVLFNNQVWKFGPTETTVQSILFWSSSPQGFQKAWAHGLNLVPVDMEYTPSVNYYPSLRTHAYPVRCLKD
ncbi:MAG: PKD-like domain-containing protein [bacterium]